MWQNILIRTFCDRHDKLRELDVSFWREVVVPRTPFLAQNLSSLILLSGEKK